MSNVLSSTCEITDYIGNLSWLKLITEAEEKEQYMDNMQSTVVYDDEIYNDNEDYNDNIVKKPNRYSYTSFEEVPLVIGAEQLSAILGISRSGAYQLLRRKDFPTVHIGKRMIVPRDLLVKWLEAQAAS